MQFIHVKLAENYSAQLILRIHCVFFKTKENNFTPFKCLFNYLHLQEE